MSARNQVIFRAGKGILPFLQERQEEGEGIGNTARRLLEWLMALLREGREELRAFSEEELLQAMEALNGILITPQTAPYLWAEMADRLGDDHPVTRKVRALSPAGRFALADLARIFWKGGAPEDPRRRLREVLGAGVDPADSADDLPDREAP